MPSVVLILEWDLCRRTLQPIAEFESIVLCRCMCPLAYQCASNLQKHIVAQIFSQGWRAGIPAYLSLWSPEFPEDSWVHRGVLTGCLPYSLPRTTPEDRGGQQKIMRCWMTARECRYFRSGSKCNNFFFFKVAFEVLLWPRMSAPMLSGTLHRHLAASNSA